MNRLDSSTWSQGSDFAFAAGRFMSEYGCRMQQEFLLLLGCPLFLAARWPEPGSGTAPWFETRNPCCYEYLAAALGSPYQLRSIDGPKALAWVEGRLARREPLLLDLPEALLLETAGEERGRRLCAYVSAVNGHDRESSRADAIELCFGPSRRTLSLETLADALLRRGDVTAVMFFPPLQPLPESYLREMLRQSLVKQHSLLRSCPYAATEVGIAWLRESASQHAGDPAVVRWHRRLLASLRPGRFGEGSPASGRAYYADALRAAAPLCGDELCQAADAFDENAAAWNAIVARTEGDEAGAEQIAAIYASMWRAEQALLARMPAFAAAGSCS